MSKTSIIRPCKICNKPFDAPRRSRQICQPCADKVGLPNRSRRYEAIEYHAPSLPRISCLERPIRNYLED